MNDLDQTRISRILGSTMQRTSRPGFGSRGVQKVAKEVAKGIAKINRKPKRKRTKK